MFYIVREWLNGLPNEQTFDDLNAARAYLYSAEGPADLYVWLAGREEFMESNERRMLI